MKTASEMTYTVSSGALNSTPTNKPCPAVTSTRLQYTVHHRRHPSAPVTNRLPSRSTARYELSHNLRNTAKTVETMRRTLTQAVRMSCVLYCTSSPRSPPASQPVSKRNTTQPCIPPGSLNRVPASAGVRAGMSPLPGGR